MSRAAAYCEIDELDLAGANTLKTTSASLLPAHALEPAMTDLAIVPTATVLGFAYAALEPALASQAKAAADRINANKDAADKSMFAIGRDLLAIKAKLPHGAFGKWITAEFDMSDRTAQNYMNATLAFEKNESVSFLPPTVIYMLAAPSTPTEIIESVIAESERGNVPTAKSVSRRISDEKEKRAAATGQVLKNAGKTPKQVTQRKTNESQAEAQGLAEIGKKSASDLELAAADAVALLKKCLGAEFPLFCDLYEKASLRFGAALKHAR
jgi:hypothetical protein